MGLSGILGDAEQNGRRLPAMVKSDKIGAFALVEPDVRSNAAQIITKARTDGVGYILQGAKRWNRNATIAEVLIIWARDEQSGGFGGYVIKNSDVTSGLRSNDICGKVGKRAVLNAVIVSDEV